MSRGLSLGAAIGDIDYEDTLSACRSRFYLSQAKPHSEELPRLRGSTRVYIFDELFYAAPATRAYRVQPILP